MAWNFVSTTSHRLCKKLIWVPKIRISKKKAVSEAHFGSIYLHFLPPSPLCNHKSVINNIKGRARNVMLKRKHMAALLETGKFFQDRLYVNCIYIQFLLLLHIVNGTNITGWNDRYCYWYIQCYRNQMFRKHFKCFWEKKNLRFGTDPSCFYKF